MRAVINCLWTNSKTIMKLYNNSNRPPVDKQHSYNKTVPYTATTTDHLWTNSTAMIKSYIVTVIGHPWTKQHNYDKKLQSNSNKPPMEK